MGKPVAFLIQIQIHFIILNNRDYQKLFIIIIMDNANTKKLIELYRKTKNKKAMDCLLINHQKAIQKAVVLTNPSILSYNERLRKY